MSPSIHKVLGPTLPELWRWRQKHPKFKATIGFIVSSRPAWDILRVYSKKLDMSQGKGSLVGGLERSVSYRLIYLNAWPLGSHVT